MTPAEAATSTTPPSSCSNTQYKGDSTPNKDCIKWIQGRLNDLGFRDWVGDALPTKGEFNKETDFVVREFQTVRGLTVDGQVGAKTVAALRKANPAGAPKPVKASDSALNNKISRSDVIARANYWVNTLKPTYSQTKGASDWSKVAVVNVPWGASPFTNTMNHYYRQDCSGFVSMAWRMGDSHTTGQSITASAGWNAKKIAWDNLKPGDALIHDGHIMLFTGWANSAKTSVKVLHTDGLSNKVPHASTYTVKELKAKSSPYVPIRYNSITD
ncbi:MAG: peptidoglycan-binding protein [Propionibacteriaceae bacterium]|nr:peptidoglycan-binding protein [Propionibacteriaceae bacterium]